MTTSRIVQYTICSSHDIVGQNLSQKIETLVRIRLELSVKLTSKNKTLASPTNIITITIVHFITIIAFAITRSKFYGIEVPQTS